MKRSTRSGLWLTWRGARRTSARFGREEGQSLYEFALTLPLLAMLLVGIIKFGIVFYDYVVLANAVASAARTLAVNRGAGTGPPTACDLALTTLQTAGVSLNLSASNIPSGYPIVTASCTSLTAGSPATYKATYPCDLSIPFIGNLCPGSTISSQTTVRIE